MELARMRFPARCCNCGVATERCAEYATGQRFWWFTRFFAFAFYARVPIPTCEACFGAARRRRWIAAALFAAVTGAIFAAVGFAVRGEDGIGAGAVFGLLFGVLAGLEVGGRIGLPVWMRDYRPLRRTVDLRFRNPEYGERVRALQGSSSRSR
jgi:hypothetical protein